MSSIIVGMMSVFTLALAGLVLAAVVKLAPVGMARSIARKVALHRQAVVALGIAMEQSRGDNDRTHFNRLAAQHDWHSAALRALAPAEAAALTAQTAPLLTDKAA